MLIRRVSCVFSRILVFAAYLRILAYPRVFSRILRVFIRVLSRILAYSFSRIRRVYGYIVLVLPLQRKPSSPEEAFLSRRSLPLQTKPSSMHVFLSFSRGTKKTISAYMPPTNGSTSTCGQLREAAQKPMAEARPLQAPNLLNLGHISARTVSERATGPLGYLRAPYRLDTPSTKTTPNGSVTHK